MQKYWSGFPFPSPGDLPNPGIEPQSPGLQTDSLPSEPPGKPPKIDNKTRTFVPTIPFKSLEVIARKNNTRKINKKHDDQK